MEDKFNQTILIITELTITIAGIVYNIILLTCNINKCAYTEA